MPPITAQHTCLQPITAVGLESPTNPSGVDTCLPPIPAQHTCLPPMAWGQGSQRSPVGCHQCHQPHKCPVPVGASGGACRAYRGASCPAVLSSSVSSSERRKPCEDTSARITCGWHVAHGAGCGTWHTVQIHGTQHMVQYTAWHMAQYTAHDSTWHDSWHMAQHMAHMAQHTVE